MRPALFSALTVLMCFGLILAGSAPGTAGPRPNHAVVKDKVGDAPSGIDLLLGRYAINRKRAVFKVRLDKLTERTFVAFEIWPLAAAWDRIVIYRHRGRTVGKVYLIDNEEETTAYLRRCPGLKVRWKPASATVRARVPHRCLMASSLGGDGPFEFHTFTRFGATKHSKHDKMPVRTLHY